MATLRDTERKEIVQRLACFETPTAVAEWASEEYEKDITPNQVHHYDPTRCDETAEKWTELFQETRKAFLNDLDTIPLSHRAVRLRELTTLYERAKEDEQLQEAARMLKQAAKEVGGAFTNETELSGKDGGPIEIKRDVKLSDAELAQIAAEHE
jgi:hypothetical protein